MPLYMLIKVQRPNGYLLSTRENVGLFDTEAKALALKTSLELELFDSGSLVGVTFEIEEHFVK